MTVHRVHGRPDFSVVLQFNVERFRQQQTETCRHEGRDAIDQHRDGVMVGGQQSHQRGEDAGHSAAHRAQTQTVLPAGGTEEEREGGGEVGEVGEVEVGQMERWR